MSKGSGIAWAAAGIIVLGNVFGGGSDTYTPVADAAAGAGSAQTGALSAAGAECVLPSLDGLDKEQADIAYRGVQAADRAGVGTKGAEIIIATGLVESGLRNLNYGDRDSLGWLQQRPSQGWGNATDVDKGADDFFREMKKLAPGWQGMDPGTVAQTVQRSAFPARYGERMPEARNIVAAIRGAEASCKPAQGVGSGGSIKANAVLAWAQTQVGKPYVLGANGPDAWDCSSFARAAMQQAGIQGMPRTARAQRDWCAAGNCAKVNPGQERPGDLIFWDSYLGPNEVGHVVIVKDPATQTTTDARGSKQGVINGKYPAGGKGKNIFDIYRPNGLA